MEQELVPVYFRTAGSGDECNEVYSALQHHRYRIRPDAHVGKAAVLVRRNLCVEMQIKKILRSGQTEFFQCGKKIGIFMA